MKPDFSEKELLMIRAISEGWYELITIDSNIHFNEVNVLKILAEDCFIKNKQGLAVDSLRRCLLAISECKPYRKTKEYDDLINLSEKPRVSMHDSGRVEVCPMCQSTNMEILYIEPNFGIPECYLFICNKCKHQYTCL